MSSLLEEAIVDAAALKEAALKNAENVVLEKYSSEVRNAIESLLEQDEMGAPPQERGDATFMNELPFAFQNEALDGPSEEEIVEIDFDALKARIEEEEAAGIEAEPAEMLEAEEVAEELNEDELDKMASRESGEDEAEMASGKYVGQEIPAGAGPGRKEDDEDDEDLDEKLELDEDLLNSVVEELVIDMIPRAAGWSSLNSAFDTAQQANNDAMQAAQQAHAEELEEEEKEEETAEDVVTIYEIKISNLSKANMDLKGLLREAKTQLQNLNLANAKLVYQNKALASTSLNERQIEKIVDAVRRADSVEGARMIFETIQDAVGSSVTKRRHPQSLREAVTRPTSLLISSNRTSEAPTYDPTAERMRQLAGIKN